MMEIEIEEMKECVSKFGYDFEKFIGFGSQSSVSLCKGKICQQEFAIKRSNKQISSEEYNTLVSLSHPNIISLYNVFNNDDYQYLVMDYCSNGTIADQGKISSDKFIHYAKQMLQALAYCHENKLSHLNIKPQNILIDQYNHIKLTDFGAPQQVDHEKEKKSDKWKSMVFSAPEVLQHKKYSPDKADIWALGVTFYYMAVGTYPFLKHCKDETRKSIIYCELDFGTAKVDPQIRFLISKMITKNAAARPTAEKLLKFPLFQTDKFQDKLNLLALQGRRHSFTFGLNNAALLSNKPMTFENNKTDDSDAEDKNLNPLLEVHCYRSVAVHPSIQRIFLHHPGCKA